MRDEFLLFLEPEFLLLTVDSSMFVLFDIGDIDILIDIDIDIYSYLKFQQHSICFEEFGKM